MPVVVTLYVFSGCPNPAWELTGEQSENLALAFPRTVDKTLARGRLIAPLGYAGFSIEHSGIRRLPSHARLYGGVAETPQGLRICEDGKRLETSLLETAGPAVSNVIRSYVQAKLSRLPNLPSPVLLVQPRAQRAPRYDPKRWNSCRWVRERNNCYNYANDKITNTYAQPGRGGGKCRDAETCESVGAAAKRDGQRDCAEEDLPVGAHYIALATRPATDSQPFDYHWYRRDSNGSWSHKVGALSATDVDNSGWSIDCPKSCDRGDYTNWCGCYICDPAKTRIL